jgi:hypothetical protein
MAMDMPSTVTELLTKGSAHGSLEFGRLIGFGVRIGKGKTRNQSAVLVTISL